MVVVRTVYMFHELGRGLTCRGAFARTIRIITCWTVAGAVLGTVTLMLLGQNSGFALVVGF